MKPYAFLGCLARLLAVFVAVSSASISPAFGSTSTETTATWGRRSAVLLSFVRTYEVGKFAVTAAREQADSGKQVYYGSELNPADQGISGIGTEDPILRPAGTTYYQERRTVKGASTTIETATSLLSVPYGNREFLIDLARSGVLPVTGISDDSTLAQIRAAVAKYTLVAVRFTKDAPVFHLFAERAGTPPIFVGLLNGEIYGQPTFAEAAYQNPAIRLFVRFGSSTVLNSGGNFVENYIGQIERTVGDVTSVVYTERAFSGAADIEVLPGIRAPRVYSDYVDRAHPLALRARLSGSLQGAYTFDKTNSRTYKTQKIVGVISHAQSLSRFDFGSGAGQSYDLPALPISGGMSLSAEAPLKDASAYLALVPEELRLSPDFGF